MAWDNDLSVPPRFVDGQRLDAVHLNNLVDFVRNLAARASRWNLVLSGGGWGLFLPAGAKPGTYNFIENNRVRKVSLILPCGTLLLGEPDEVVGEGHVGEDAVGDLAESWTRELPRLLASGEDGLEWRAPVIHIGAEPRIWSLAEAIAAQLGALEQRLATLRSIAADRAAALRLLIGSVASRLTVDPRHDTAALAAMVDPIIEAFGGLLEVRPVPPSPIAAQAPEEEARRGLEKRLNSLVSLLSALDGLEKPRISLQPRQEIRFAENLNRVYFLAAGEGWLSSRGTSPASYGLSEEENGFPTMFTNLEPNQKVSVKGQFLHVNSGPELQILVEVLGP